MNLRPSLTRLSSVTSVARDIWVWWLKELAGLLPISWRDRLQGRIEARIEGSNIDLQIVRASLAEKGTFLGLTKSVEPESFRHTLARRRGRLPVWLIPPAGSVLSRSITLPRSAAAVFARLLQLEADRWTPYASTEIIAAWQRNETRGDSAKVDIELRFAPFGCVTLWKRQLAELGLVPSVIVLGSAPEFRARIVDVESGTGMRRVRPIALAALVLATAGFVVGDWAEAVRERDGWRRHAESERQNYAVQRDLERRIDNVLAVIAEKGAGEKSIRPRGAWLPGLARSLPETDWLTEVILRKDTATLRGFTAKPEMLLKALEATASEHDVRLQGELAMDAKLQRERFSVGFEIGEGSP